MKDHLNEELVGKTKAIFAFDIKGSWDTLSNTASIVFRSVSFSFQELITDRSYP